MKTTQECWQALIDGEKLESTGFGLKEIVHLENGELVNQHGKQTHMMFTEPPAWSIYKKPKWYDNIPEGGMLCWLNNTGDRCQTKGTVTRYIKFEGYLAEDGWYERATPLTKQEIEVFMDNAPEEAFEND